MKNLKNEEYKNRKHTQRDFSSFKHIRTFDDFIKWLYYPTDPSSLGIIRLMFGLLMMIDTIEERGGSEIDFRWGESRDCHFPLFSFMKPLSYPYMSIIYGIMWIGALGIALGYKFKISISLFSILYWYLLLLDKSYWNNHSYLFGIVTILLAGSSANHYCSIDGILDKSKRNAHVPYWNYFILKFQFFMLYFLAGLKKTDFEWLEGYSMVNLGRHWVFDPFKLILTTEQIDYLIIHWFGFFLDLTIGFWLLYKPTRPFAMIFCASFHLMNSRLFTIGMFPYVCLATMPLFCQENWFRKIYGLFLKGECIIKPSDSCLYAAEKGKNGKVLLPSNVSWKHRFVGFILLMHCGLQGFLPYSHSITKGYNNWTSGLYGYSWDMMVHSWDTVLVVVKVVDNVSGQEYFLDSTAWVQNDRWNKHADMCLQYAHCLKNNLIKESKIVPIDSSKTRRSTDELSYIKSNNISIYIDVWCSLNGRFQQRMYNPNYDLLKANWSPFRPVEWLLPILSEYSESRGKLTEIQREVYSWSNYSDVLFIADFSGFHLENFISTDLINVTLYVLKGEIYYEIEDDETEQSLAVKLNKGDSLPVETGIFHKIHTVGSVPACYMYTYINKTKEELKDNELNKSTKHISSYSPFPVIEDLEQRVERLGRMISHISDSVLNILFNKPFPKRKRS